MGGWFRGVVLFLLLLGAGAALGQTLRVMPIPPHIRPQWNQLPDNPKIFHAPNIPADVFKGAGGAGYYLKLGDLWYHSRTMDGPWNLMSEVPEYLYRIGPEYFKSGQATATAKPPIAVPPRTTPQPPAAGMTPGPKPTAKVEPTPSRPAGSGAAGVEPPPGPTAQATSPTLPSSTAADPPAAAKPSPLAPPPEPIFLNDPGPK